MFEFEGNTKIPRWSNEEVFITEKIDGTYAAINIDPEDGSITVESRKRLIYPGKETDNFGFAAWVHEHAGVLTDVLGFGRHKGEWWGSGIQSGYGLTNGDKRFSLFNTGRFGVNSDGNDRLALVDGLDTVPELYNGPFAMKNALNPVEFALELLRQHGSFAAEFDRPEGVVVNFKLSRVRYKAFVNDTGPKSMTIVK